MGRTTINLRLSCLQQGCEGPERVTWPVQNPRAAPGRARLDPRENSHKDLEPRRNGCRHHRSLPPFVSSSLTSLLSVFTSLHTSISHYLPLSALGTLPPRTHSQALPSGTAGHPSSGLPAPTFLPGLVCTPPALLVLSHRSKEFDLQ